jgi:hypothetical protein
MFKPEIRNTLLPFTSLDTAKISVPLQQALRQNGIDSIINFRVVKLYKGLYYQVKQKGCDSLTYLNVESGNVLTNGDKHYAGFLAQRFLWEENGSKYDEHHHSSLTASLINAPTAKEPKHDETKAKISGNKLITRFSSEYRASNKLLPVYEVAFDRNDSIRLYVDTRTDRLAFASDAKKRWFTGFFAFAHSWSFLNGLGHLKTYVLGLFSALCFLSSLFGFAVYNVMKSKSKTATGAKGWHYILGNIFFVTTLLFAFSGAWHAFAKLPANETNHTKIPQAISANDLNIRWNEIVRSLGKDEQLVNVSAVSMGSEIFWQVTYACKKLQGKKYINTKTGESLVDGDLLYGRHLATTITDRKNETVTSVKNVTQFSNSYSMMNKRLPVIETSFKNGDKIFIETVTGSVAGTSSSSVQAERFSFSNLHMHHYWEMWLGKSAGNFAKNSVLISSTLGLAVLALTGLLVYFKKKINTKRKGFSRTIS